VDVSADGLSMFLSEYSLFRAGGLGGGDLWSATRAANTDPWGSPVNLGPSVNTGAWDATSDISTHGSTLYFASNRPGGSGGVGLLGMDLWQAPILPVVDFTGDYLVDIEDLIILIEHWGQNEPSFDMGPMPWGDGVVDAADLEVLMSYWGRVVYDPHFLANWKLDEIEGDVAYDSAAQNDAVVFGDATWQPEARQIDGALQLDGIDDYVQTPRILNPADGVFSVLAWIKGGAPGQVIISQEDGADWLLTDTQGYLMTALKSGGRRSGDALISETIITDGSWHRIGFTWDGTNRILYIDDVEVSRDTLGGLKGSDGGLYIGTGKGFEEGTFWSGLIDDVQIYDRAVAP